MEDFEKSIKVIIVGNGRVGKTSMMMRYTKGVMTDKYKKTIGTDFCEKDLELDSGDEVKLMLWDTAGQEMFSQLTKQYYRGARACVLTFSTTDRESFEAIEGWYQKVIEECPKICGVLVQNKIDMVDEAKMEEKEVEDLAAKLGMKLYRASVKTNTLIEQLFEDLAMQVVEQGFDEEEEDEGEGEDTSGDSGAASDQTTKAPEKKAAKPNVKLDSTNTTKPKKNKSPCSIV
jgi:Ras-related protein Rab-23